MTDMPQPERVVTYVNTGEVVNRPAPLLTAGPLAWIRRNLFSSVFDTALTFLFAITVIGAIYGLVNWSIQQANWFVVTLNLRQFMLGRYEVDPEWRVHLAAMLVVFGTGIALAAFSRVRWRTFAALAIVAAVLVAVPVVIEAALPLPPLYVTAGNMPIASGSVTQEAQSRLAFTARAGEEFRIAVAAQAGGDEALAVQSGFMDKATNNLRNAAESRLLAQARLAELDRLLASDLLTANQRVALTGERDRLTIPDPVVERYAVNQAAVTVRVLRGTTLEVLAEATLSADSGPLSVTLPDEGWYVLEKTIAGDAPATAILRVDGMYPLLQRSFSRADAGGGSAGRVNQYIRMTDNFLTEAPLPKIDGQDVPFAVIIDNQYRGVRPFADYLRVHLAPFLKLITPALWQALILLALGVVAGRLADRFFSPADRPRRTSVRVATWLIIVLPIVAFFLAYGVGNVLPVTDTRNWGGLLLTMMLTVVGIIGSFPLGVLLALGRRSDLPVVRYLSILYIETVRGVPLVTVLFMAQLLVPFLNPALADIDAVFRAMVGITLFSAAYLAENVRGGLQAIPPGQVEAARALGLAGWQITLFITLPQALRAVIPALVGQCISLFKDTSLVTIVGLIDLTGISNAVVAQTEFIGLRREAYVFITVLYFVFSYAMSYVSRRLEMSGSGAVRRA